MADINVNFNLKYPDTKNQSPIRLVVRGKLYNPTTPSKIDKIRQEH
jgi:hypothetical protein